MGATPEQAPRPTTADIGVDGLRTARRADRARVARRGDEEDEIVELRDVGGGAAARDEAGAAWPGRSLSTLLAALRRLPVLRRPWSALLTSPRTAPSPALLRGAPSRRASARVAQHPHLVLFVVVVVAGVFGDAGAVCSSRGT